jgi:hypothetical protein
MRFDDPFPDPLPVAGSAAVLGGVASIWEPFFLGLCVAASAMAGVAWLVRAGNRKRSPKASEGRRSLGMGVGLLVTGWTVYLAAGAYLGRFVALPLAATAGLLWVWGARLGGQRGVGG